MGGCGGCINSPDFFWRIAMKTGKSFKSMGLSDEVLKAIDKLGFRHPTPVQRQAIPSILTGVDAVALARTGSGKTAAFAIPAVNRLGKHSEIVGVRAVVLSPTRELAMQTCKVFQLLARFTDLRIALIVGGHSMDGQFDRLMNNPDIIIATPGRLVHHLDQGAGFSLGKVEMLILDEADRLFELGFSDQVHSILKSCPQNRQALLFSATLPSQLVQFAKIGLSNPEFIRLDSECTLSDNLKIQMAFTRNESKPAALMGLIRALRSNKADPNSIGKTIVFVATRHHVDFIGQLMEKCCMGTITTIYGSMEQQVRSNSLAKFRSGYAKILIVTDVAARGIDIPDVDNVIHYDFPCSPKLFIHRTGRTARNGKSGTCIGMTTQSDMPYVFDLVMFIGADLTPRRSISKIFCHNDDIIVQSHHREIEIGGIPYIDDDIEMYNRVMVEDTDLDSAKKSMEFAMQPYYKTRPSASKQAVRTSREFSDSIGGMQNILSDHLSLFGNEEDDECTIIDQLRKFRPNNGGAAGSSIGSVVKSETKKSLEDKLFGSMRARNIAREILEAAASEAAVVGEDEVVSGPPRRQDHRRDFRSRKFYLDITQDGKEDTDGQLEEHQLDIMPETSEEISKAHIAKKWDKKKMKYVGVRIGADGNAITEKRRRNESGVKVTVGGKKGSSAGSFYDNWSKKTRKQIQKVGEIEASGRGSMMKEESRKYEGGRRDEESSKSRKVESKEYKGQIPWGFLTNKQKRLETRRMKGGKDGVTSRGGGERKTDGLKTASSIAKERKLKGTRRILQDKKKRKEFHKESKEAYMRKQRTKMERSGALSRSWAKKAHSTRH